MSNQDEKILNHLYIRLVGAERVCQLVSPPGSLLVENGTIETFNAVNTYVRRIMKMLFGVVPSGWGGVNVKGAEIDWTEASEKKTWQSSPKATHSYWNERFGGERTLENSLSPIKENTNQLWPDLDLLNKVEIVEKKSDVPLTSFPLIRNQAKGFISEGIRVNRLKEKINAQTKLAKRITNTGALKLGKKYQSIVSGKFENRPNSRNMTLHDRQEVIRSQVIGFISEGIRVNRFKEKINAQTKLAKRITNTGALKLGNKFQSVVSSKFENRPNSGNMTLHDRQEVIRKQSFQLSQKKSQHQISPTEPAANLDIESPGGEGYTDRQSLELGTHSTTELLGGSRIVEKIQRRFGFVMSQVTNPITSHLKNLIEQPILPLGAGPKTQSESVSLSSFPEGNGNLNSEHKLIWELFQHKEHFDHPSRRPQRSSRLTDSEKINFTAQAENERLELDVDEISQKLARYLKNEARRFGIEI